MVARYRKLDPRCWDDERFVEWDDGKRNLWLLLLLGPAVEIVPGLQTGGVGSLAETLRRPYKTVRKQFDELLVQGRLQVDERFRLIRVNRAPRYNQPANPNQVRGWYSSWTSLPESPLKYLHVASLMSACELADSEYSPYIPKAKKGVRTAGREQSKTPFMDAFLERFSQVDVDGKLDELNASETVPQTLQNTMATVQQYPEEQLPEQLPEPLPPRACVPTRARTPNDLGSGSGSGSGTGARAGEGGGERGRESDSADAPPTDSAEAPSPPPEPTKVEVPPEGQDSKAFELLPVKPSDPKKPGRKPGTNHRIPDDWKPKGNHIKLANERGRDLDFEVEKFRDYCLSKGVVRVDWDATFRNWLRNEFGNGGNSGGMRRVQTEEDWVPTSNPDCAKALREGGEDEDAV